VRRDPSKGQTATGRARSLAIRCRSRGGIPGGEGPDPGGPLPARSPPTHTPSGYRSRSRFQSRLLIRKALSPAHSTKQAISAHPRKKKGNPRISKGCLVGWRRRVGIEPPLRPSSLFIPSATAVSLPLTRWHSPANFYLPKGVESRWRTRSPLDVICQFDPYRAAVHKLCSSSHGGPREPPPAGSIRLESAAG